MSVIGEEPKEFVSVGAKKVDFFKMIDNGQWWQMSQRIQRKDQKISTGFGR